MRKSFFVALALALSFGGALCAVEESISTGSGLARLNCGVEYDRSQRRQQDLAMEEYLNLADRVISRFFRLGRATPKIPCRLSFERQASCEVVEYQVAPERVTLVIGDDFARWRQQPAVRQAILRMMLLSAFGVDPTAAAGLPAWVVVGLDTEVEARLRADLIYRVGYYPGIAQALLAGATPDWVTCFIADADLSDATGPLLELYRENARMMLEMGYQFSSPKDNALADYTLMWLKQQGTARERFFATIGRAARGRESSLDLSPEAATVKAMHDFTRKRCFSPLQPPPGAVTLRRFRELRRISCQAMDANDTLIELSGDLTELPGWVARYPEALLLPKKKAMELDALRAGSSLVTAGEFGALSHLLARLPTMNPEQAEPELRRAVAALEEACERQDRIAAMLLTGAGTPGVVPSRDAIRWTVAAVRQPAGELGPEIEKFLDQTEDSYLNR